MVLEIWIGLSLHFGKMVGGVCDCYGGMGLDLLVCQCY